MNKIRLIIEHISYGTVELWAVFPNTENQVDLVNCSDIVFDQIMGSIEGMGKIVREEEGYIETEYDYEVR